MADCPICMAQASRFRLKLYDDRYACPGMFDVYNCRECNHSFLATTHDTPAIDRIYTDYYPRATFDPDDIEAKSFPGGFTSWLNGDDCSACKWVPPGVRILDVGCGFCETLLYHLSRGCDTYGVEADENIRGVVERNRFNVHLGPFDPELYSPGFFDYVTMQQVIEHVDAPLATLEGVATILRPGGRAILTTPNAQGWGARIFGRRWINWHSPYHRHFFSRTSMQLAAQSAGLQVEFVKTVTNSEWLRYQWAHLLTFPDAGEPSPFWSPHGDRGLFIRVAQKSTDLLHYARINHLLTRLFDSLGVGDNYLFLLQKP